MAVSHCGGRATSPRRLVVVDVVIDLPARTGERCSGASVRIADCRGCRGARSHARKRCPWGRASKTRATRGRQERDARTAWSTTGTASNE